MTLTDPPRTVRICPEPVILDHHAWPCIHAEGHAGPHHPPAEAVWCHRPLRDMDHAELIAAASLAFTQLAASQRDARDSLARAEQWSGRVARLARYVVENTKRSSGAHDPGCWTRHAHCLASAIWTISGLDAAERYLADLAGQPVDPQQPDLLDELAATP